MRIPSLTIRRLMVIVALAAAILAGCAVVTRRRARFERLASYHLSRTGPAHWTSFSGTRYDTAKGQWHHVLGVKYSDAARHPWLPVAPDPPEPE
jgi:hypothetical protein